MKEDDAKEKWCPYASSRVVVVPTQGGSKVATINCKEDEFPKMTCIGSACMVWRQHSQDDAEAGGYCGLAGKP